VSPRFEQAPLWRCWNYQTLWTLAMRAPVPSAMVSEPIGEWRELDQRPFREVSPSLQVLNVAFHRGSLRLLRTCSGEGDVHPLPTSSRQTPVPPPNCGPWPHVQARQLGAAEQSALQTTWLDTLDTSLMVLLVTSSVPCSTGQPPDVAAWPCERALSVLLPLSVSAACPSHAWCVFDLAVVNGASARHASSSFKDPTHSTPVARRSGTINCVRLPSTIRAVDFMASATPAVFVGGSSGRCGLLPQPRLP